MNQENLMRKFYPPQKNWKAYWVWPEDCGQDKNCYYFFRKEFNIEYLKQDYTLYITAESRYRLFINGILVRDGSPVSQPYYKYYDARNITTYLKSGSNCIAVLVYHIGHNTELRGGLIAELSDSDGEIVTATGNSWRAVRALAWRDNTQGARSNVVFPYQEVVDFNQIPTGWNNTGFNDNGWKRAKVLNSGKKGSVAMPWSYLAPRDIPFMQEYYQLPRSIIRVDECLSIKNRWRPEDISICLSTPGLPVQHTTVKDAENLLSESGTTLLKNSTTHNNGVFDGIYDPCILLDFGKVITAHIEIEFEGVKGGTVDIGYAERLLDGYFNNSIECHFCDRVVMKNGRQVFRSFAWRGFRYIRLRFGSCFDPVILHSVKALVTTYPYEEKGRFYCSDNRTNDIFEMCRHTIRLCSNEFLMDTPWREQGQWLGDVSAVTQGGIYSCFGDYKLMAKFLKQSALCQKSTGLLSNKTNELTEKWQNCIVDFSLWWIQALWKHYLYTGDEIMVLKFYPQVSRVVHGLLPYIDEYGLLNNVPYWIFLDWASVDKRGECTALNAIFYGTLETVEKMARLTNDCIMQKLAEEVRNGIKTSFVDRLFDNSKGCFTDANVNGTMSDRISEHGNLSPILWGLCDKETCNRIIESFYVQKNVRYTEAQPFFTSVVLKALHQAERFDLAVQLLQERWGTHMVDQGATSCYEEWYMNGSRRDGVFKGFFRTLSHAWSAFPAEYLTSYLIGLEIIEAGGAKVKLNPVKTNFDYEIEYPLMLGIIKVSYKEGQFNIELPDGVERI